MCLFSRCVCLLCLYVCCVCVCVCVCIHVCNSVLFFYNWFAAFLCEIKLYIIIDNRHFSSLHKWWLVHIFAAVIPRNLHITPRQSTYQPGDRIYCSAEGNPATSYQWTDLTNGTVIQGAVLIISKVMVDESHAFQCSATNYYNGVMHKDSTAIVFSVISAGICNCRISKLCYPFFIVICTQTRNMLYGTCICPIPLHPI